MAEPITPRRTYLLVYIGLLILTTATTAIAFVNLGPFSTVIAVTIASMKAALIVLFFMELIHSPVLTRVIAISALVWLGIMMSMTITDYVTRGWVPVPGK